MSPSILVTLYAVGFCFELGGGFLVAMEIVRDVRAARRLASPGAENPPAADITIGGMSMVLAAQTADTFREFTLDRLEGGLRWRVLGVALLVVGAVVQFVANIGSAF